MSIQRYISDAAYQAILASDEPSSTNPFITESIINTKVLTTFGSVQDDPTGFENQTDSEYSFVDTTRTFEINPTSGSFGFYVKGKYFSKNSAENITITDVEGIHAIVYDNTGTLVHLAPGVWTETDIIIDNVYIVAIYWDADNKRGKIFDERHGHKMPSSVHTWLHKYANAQYNSGMQPGNFTIGTGINNTDVRFSISGGSITDEDILKIIEPVTLDGADKDIYYLDALGNVRWFDNQTAPIRTFDGTNSTRLVYNPLGLGLVEVPDNSFVLVHTFALNNGKYGFIVGQKSYNTVTDARAGILIEGANLYYGQMEALTAEFVLVSSSIYQCRSSYSNDYNARIVEIESGVYFYDWRNAKIQGNSGVSTSDHALLVNLQGGAVAEYYHLRQTAYSNLLAQDQTVYTSSTPKFQGLIFDPTYVITGSEILGTTYYNSNEDNLNTVLANSIIQHGEELYYNSNNGTGSTLLNGRVAAYIGTTGNSGRILVDYWNGQTMGAHYAIGIFTHDIANGANGKVTMFGKIRGIDTTGATLSFGGLETWSDSDELWADPVNPGYLTNVMPSVPNHIVSIAAVIHAHPSNGTLLVRPTYSQKLEELSNVNGTTPLDGYVLAYNQTNGYWDPTDISAIYTPKLSTPATYEQLGILQTTSTGAYQVGNIYYVGTEAELTDVINNATGNVTIYLTQDITYTSSTMEFVCDKVQFLGAYQITFTNTVNIVTSNNLEVNFVCKAIDGGSPNLAFVHNNVGVSVTLNFLSFNAQYVFFTSNNDSIFTINYQTYRTTAYSIPTLTGTNTTATRVDWYNEYYLHNNVEGLQGGTSGEYYHLTAAQYTALTTNLNLQTVLNGGSTATVSSAISISSFVGMSLNAQSSGITMTATTSGGINLNSVSSAGIYLNSDAASGGIFLTTAGSGPLRLTNNSTTQYLELINITGSGILLRSEVGDMVIQDNSVNPSGIIYAADYSATYTNRSLVDKAYADTKISKVTSTDNAIVRFDEITGTVQDSAILIDDSWNVTGINNLEIAQYLSHAGDTDTRINFQTDRIDFETGNGTFLRFISTNAWFNPNGIDMDFVFDGDDGTVARVDGGNTSLLVGNGSHNTSAAWLNLAASTTTKASLNLYGGDNPTTPTSGDLWFNSGGNKAMMYDGTYTHRITSLKHKSITIENPLATDEFIIWVPKQDITIRGLYYVVTGSTSVSFDIIHSGATELVGTDLTATSTQQEKTSTWKDNTCAGGAAIKFKASAISGTPTSINVTIYYTVD